MFMSKVPGIDILILEVLINTVSRNCSFVSYKEVWLVEVKTGEDVLKTGRMGWYFKSVYWTKLTTLHLSHFRSVSYLICSVIPKGNRDKREVVLLVVTKTIPDEEIGTRNPESFTMGFYFRSLRIQRETERGWKDRDRGVRGDSDRFLWS